MSVPRRQLQRPVEVLQRFIVPAQARAQKASLTKSLGVPRVPRNGFIALEYLGLDIKCDRSACSVKRHGFHDAKKLGKINVPPPALNLD